MAYVYGRLANAFFNLGDTKKAMKYANLHLTGAKGIGNQRYGRSCVRHPWTYL